MPKRSEIRLVKTRIRSMNFRITSIDPKGQIPVNFSISSGYNYDYRKKTIEVLISISIDNDQMPFSLEMEFEGLFLLNKRTPKKKAEPFAKINCPAILFPFLRECVADITRRAGFNPLLLPAINFLELVEKEKREKNLQP